MNINKLQEALGNTDIYLIDQILKGRFNTKMKILDAGCGEGRNLHWFLKEGFEIYGTDTNKNAINMLGYICRSMNRQDAAENLFDHPLEESLFPPQAFDFIICSAVLHFARNETHFFNMISELDRILKPGGGLFIRTASLTGMKAHAIHTENGVFELPDGSQRFLLTEEILEKVLNQTLWEFTEPLKTVVVDRQRSMATLMLHKKP
jgi:tellurite methyltransferase